MMVFIAGPAPTTAETRVSPMPSLIARPLRVTRARVKGIIVALLKERVQEL